MTYFISDDDLNSPEDNMKLFEVLCCTFARVANSVSATRKKTSIQPLRFAARVLLLGGLAATGSLTTLHAATPCVGGSAISGFYGLSAAGATPSGTGKWLTGMVFFDGGCNMYGDMAINENFTTTVLNGVSGTYTGNTDKTILLKFMLPGASSAETYDLAYSPIFNEAVGVETDPSAIASIDLKAQSYPAGGNHFVYNNSLFKGTWAASCIGTSSTDSDLNYFTFDGSSSSKSSGYGNLSGIDRTNGYAEYMVNPYVGTYYVFPDGEFVGSLTVSNTPVNISGIIDNNLNELQFVYNNPSIKFHGFDFCTAKRIS